MSWKPTPRLAAWQPPFSVEGTRLERFYHHWFTNDRYIVELVRELGLEDRVAYKPTRTGMYFANQIYRLSTPLDVLRFPVLPIADRLRLGLTVLRARQVRDWREIDHISAAEWLRKLGGEQRLSDRLGAAVAWQVWTARWRGIGCLVLEQTEIAWRQPRQAGRGAPGLLPRRLCWARR